MSEKIKYTPDKVKNGVRRLPDPDNPVDPALELIVLDDIPVAIKAQGDAAKKLLDALHGKGKD